MTENQLIEHMVSKGANTNLKEVVYYMIPSSCIISNYDQPFFQENMNFKPFFLILFFEHRYLASYMSYLPDTFSVCS